MNCGDVFCDRCGDCIYCYGDDPCYDEGDHSYEALEKDTELITLKVQLAHPTVLGNSLEYTCESYQVTDGFLRLENVVIEEETFKEIGLSLTFINRYFIK